MFNINRSDNLSCPKCHSSSTERNKHRILGGTRDIAIAAFLLIFFGTTHPILLIITFAVFALLIAVNLTMWVKFRNYWEMECTRCNTRFFAPNPDNTNNSSAGGVRKIKD